MPVHTALYPCLLLFISGFCSLVYQTLWVKQLGLMIGIDVYAMAIVISGFFCGLSLGSYLFGRLAEASASPGRLYAVLELATAVAALLVLLWLWQGAALYVWLEDSLGVLAWLLVWFAIAVPAVFMGGTFLALLKYVLAQPESGRQLGGSVGLLYGCNTLGAIIGTVATPFLLIPGFGVIGAACFAVSLNLLLAALAGLTLVAPMSSAKTATEIPQASSAVDTADRRRLAIAIYGAVGFAAIAYEVIWGQMIIQFLSTRAHAYATMLGLYLAGLAVGNLVMSRYVDRLENLWWTLALLLSIAAGTAIAAVAWVDADLIRAQQALGKWVFTLSASKSWRMLAEFFSVSAFFIALPTLCFGAAFPVVTRLTSAVGAATHSCGRVLAINTAGGVVASLLTGFVLIPALGTVPTMALVTTLLCLLAALALWQSPAKKLWLLAPLAVVVVAVTIAPNKFAQLLAQIEGGELIYFEEGVGNSVAILEQGSGDKTFRRLYIQGVSNTGDVMASRRYMRLQGTLPLLLFDGEPRSALVIGMGTGITAGSLLNFPGLKQRVVAELLPEVAEASYLFSGNYLTTDNVVAEQGAATVDRQLLLSLGDGRHKLLRESQRYDLITLEPPPPAAAGVNNLYSSDFYALAKTRLTERGLFAQWWPLPTQSPTASRSMVRSMLDSFSYVSLWTTELHEMLIIGSMHPIEIDAERIQRRLAHAPLSTMLTEVGINGTAGVLATYMMGREQLEDFAGAAKPVTDDDPRLEYDPWVSENILLDVLPELIARQQVIGGLPEGVERDYLLEREKLRAFYYAGLASYSGDRQAWQQTMDRLYRADSDNAYYNWFRPQ